MGLDDRCGLNLIDYHYFLFFLACCVPPSQRWCSCFFFPLFAYVFQEGPHLALHFYSNGRFALLPKSRPPEDSSLDSLDKDFLHHGLESTVSCPVHSDEKMVFFSNHTGRFALLPKNRPADDSSLDSLDKDFDKCMRLYLDHADAEEELGAQGGQLFVRCGVIYDLTWTTVCLYLDHAEAEKELGAQRRQLFVGCGIIYVLTWTTVCLQLVHSGAKEELGAR